MHPTRAFNSPDDRMGVLIAWRAMNSMSLGESSQYVAMPTVIRNRWGRMAWDRVYPHFCRV